MRNLAFLLLVFLGIPLKGQKTTCDAIVHWRYTNDILIYDQPNGVVLKKLKNDTINEDFIHLTILEEKGNWFQVEIGLSINAPTYTGWIEKGQYVGTFLKESSIILNLTLYKYPSMDTGHRIELVDWKSGFITIQSCQGEWVYVTITYKGERVSGWVEANQLCANNYSTCG